MNGHNADTVALARQWRAMALEFEKSALALEEHARQLRERKRQCLLLAGQYDGSACDDQ